MIVQNALPVHKRLAGTNNVIGANPNDRFMGETT